MRVAARMVISCIILFETKLNSAQVTNNLSAIGSKIFPNLDDWLNDLARQPSKKSLRDEIINIANPAKTILNSVDIKITTKIGAEIILKKVNILGNIYLFICL